MFDYAEAWFNKGVALNDLRHHDVALSAYDRAILFKSDYAEAWSNKANTLNSLKRYDEALTHYENALALKPNVDFVLAGLNPHQ